MITADIRIAPKKSISEPTRSKRHPLRSFSIVFLLIHFLPKFGFGLEIVDIRPTVVRGSFVDAQSADQLASLAAFDPVGLLSISGNTASGTLIHSSWVLTAAHVIGSGPGQFDLSGSTFSIGGLPMAASYAVVNPGWNGDLGSGYDLALVKLAAPVTSIAPASFADAPAQLSGQTVTFVGFGQGGTGSTGTEPGTAGVKRAGTNTLDVDGSVLGMSSSILFADFDSGSAGDNSFGTSTPSAYESLIAPGDSGGGVFLQTDGSMLLVGVNSFVASFTGDADSSYGNVAGFVAIHPQIAWIQSIAHAPEPASILLGFVCALLIWRIAERRRHGCDSNRLPTVAANRNRPGTS